MIHRTREGEASRIGLNWDYVPWQFGRNGCGVTLILAWTWRGEFRRARLRYATSGRRRLIVDLGSSARDGRLYWTLP